jgi:hypothetical protein
MTLAEKHIATKNRSIACPGNRNNGERNEEQVIVKQFQTIHYTVSFMWSE